MYFEDKMTLLLLTMHHAIQTFLMATKARKRNSIIIFTLTYGSGLKLG
jgi:hypothetical protein